MRSTLKRRTSITSIPEEDLLAEIKRLADGDSPPTYHEFNKDAKYAASTVASEFGSWNAGLRQAGYSPNEKKNVPEEDLLKQLQAGASGTSAPSWRDFDWGYSSSVYQSRFGSWWQAVVLAGLSPRCRRPLTPAQFSQFFDSARGQQQPKYELTALLSQFTGLESRLIPHLDESWLMERPRGVLVQVPPEQTGSGNKWTFKLPGSWSDDGTQRKTGLPGLLKWYLGQYDSICSDEDTVSKVVFRVAADAKLSTRERTVDSKLGDVPLVRPSDLRATGGVRMAGNGAPARRIRRHLGIEHTNWKADVEDFFLWCAVHDEEFSHPDWEPSGATQRALEWVHS